MDYRREIMARVHEGIRKFDCMRLPEQGGEIVCANLPVHLARIQLCFVPIPPCCLLIDLSVDAPSCSRNVLPLSCVEISGFLPQNINRAEYQCVSYSRIHITVTKTSHEVASPDLDNSTNRFDPCDRKDTGILPSDQSLLFHIGVLEACDLPK